PFYVPPDEMLAELQARSDVGRTIAECEPFRHSLRTSRRGGISMGDEERHRGVMQKVIGNASE
ncbi:MAG: hypothetical protein QOG74_938, partial [Alphaproteobacteria bacterium]|nr:hypothetical protein [Alphaproteobacteria bacterium]